MTSLAAGKPAPLGASYDGKGVNFALFSAHAERVELCVFDEQGNEQRFDLPARSGDIWHGWLAAAGPGLRYGYRVHGPWDPAQGHRFNPAKLLIDPSATGSRAICLTMSACTAACGSPIAATAPRSRQNRRWWICAMTGVAINRRVPHGGNGDL